MFGSSAPRQTADRQPKPLVSVVVLTRNGSRWLKRCLESVAASDYPAVEVIAVDNGSSDDSISILAGFKGVRIVAAGENLGYALGNNLGAQRSKGEFLFFLNDDTWVEETAVSRLVGAMGGSTQTGFCAGEICEYDSDTLVNCGVLLDIFGFPWKGATPEGGSSGFIYADGCALFVRAEVFRRLGGFDPHHFIFAEDSDLCWRGAITGYPTLAVPGARIHHYGGGVTTHSVFSKSNPDYERVHFTSTFRRRLTERNTLVNVARNYSPEVLVFLLPLYLVASIAEAVIFALFRRKSGMFGAYIWAWGSAARQLRSIIRARKALQSARVVGDRQLMGQMHWGYSKLETAMTRGLPRIKQP
jgi:GT2 family glycosyltransferase